MWNNNFLTLFYMSGKCESANQQEITDGFNYAGVTSGSDGICINSNDNTKVYASAKDFREYSSEHKNKFRDKFFELYRLQDSNTSKHGKIACLLEYMIKTIEKNKQTADETETNLELTKDYLKNQKKILDDQIKSLESNENSDLVVKYRNENTAKTNKSLNTYFTVYITFIVFFLVIEGIVFFVN